MKSLIAASILTSLLLASCSKEDNPVEKTYEVRYNIGCTDCMVVYVSDTAGTQSTEYHQNSSWTYSFFGKADQEVLLLAYNTGGAPQGVNVRITVNDSTTVDKTHYCAISGVSLGVDTLR